MNQPVFDALPARSYGNVQQNLAPEAFLELYGTSLQPDDPRAPLATGFLGYLLKHGVQIETISAEQADAITQSVNLMSACTNGETVFGANNF